MRVPPMPKKRLAALELSDASPTRKEAGRRSAAVRLACRDEDGLDMNG